jgi:hypothetical protein
MFGYGSLLTEAATFLSWRSEMSKFAVPVWVEFEIKGGQPATSAHKAMLRAVEAMKSVLEQGSGVGQTGVKPGSVRAEIADQARV